MRAILTIAMLLLLACSAPAQESADYRLDSDDVIAIEVTRHADVSKTIKIPTDGKLRLTRLTRPVVARGLTCAELVELLTKRLTTEGTLRLRPGQVQVSLIERRPRRVYLRGNAIGGTQFDLVNGWRISELLAVAGRIPQPERVSATLTNPKRPAPIAVDLAAIYKDANSAANVLLIEGDTLTVEAPRPKRLFITGLGAPLGEHEIDERFGLRRALIKLGVTTRDNPGDLTKAVIKRKKTPGDPNAAEERLPVDLLALLTDDSLPEIPLFDMDTLDIPASNRFVYFYGADSQARRFAVPQDRKTRLFDIMTQVGGFANNSKAGSVTIWRGGQDGKQPTKTVVDWGKFIQDGNPERNPELFPEDIIVVPQIKRIDPWQGLWQAVGSIQAFQFLRGIRF